MELTAQSVAGHLRSRGLIGRDAAAEVSELGGGVSCVVLAVHAEDRALVVKQARRRHVVADEWPAKRERTLTEAAALAFAGEVVPDAVPRVLDVDAEKCVIVIEHAPSGWRDWKAELLAGRVDPAVAHRFGTALSAWHAASTDDPAIAARFDDPEAFEQLRIDPYFRTTMTRVPEIVSSLSAYIDRLLANRRCLVHGDYTPKNVLIDPSGDGLWVVDWEVAHHGDPAFDVASVLNHLLLKAIHRPASSAQYREAAMSFIGAYASSSPLDDIAYVTGLTGCLMVARVHGKSPAEYLLKDEAVMAARIGSDLLRDPPSSFDDLWDGLDER